jgi:hypothetical protein
MRTKFGGVMCKAIRSFRRRVSRSDGVTGSLFEEQYVKIYVSAYRQGFMAAERRLRQAVSQK